MKCSLWTSRASRCFHGIPVLLASMWMIQMAARDAWSSDRSKPNVILIMTDNHGAWTLGCYGNPDIRSPNIDRLAREGTLFERAFACNPVCSPTRASYLTGLIPSQHGVHCFLFGGRLQIGPEARCTLDKLRSLPEILRDQGYRCGLVGKWHLGGNLTPQEGFDDYWVTMPHGATSTFYGAKVIESGEIREEPTYLTDFWTRHAVNFIEQQVERKKPFFLFLSYNGPYALGRLLLKEGQNRHAAYYRTRSLPSFPREPAHPWLYNNRDFINNRTSIRRVATEVSGVDDGVGTILETLKRLGIDRKTLILFVADQGWVGGQGGFFGMGDHTRPVTARDGMMRVPMIWWEPGAVPAGKRVGEMVSIVDVLPSLLGHLGLADEMPESPRSPGRDFSGLFRGEQLSDWKNEVFYEFESLRSIRTDRWKYVHRFPNGPHELYDLKHDASESTNLVDAAEHSAVRNRLRKRLDQFFAEYSEDRFDLWRGGTSQTRLLVWNEATPDQTSEDKAGHSKPKAGKVSPAPAAFQPAPIDVPEGFDVSLAAAPPLVQHPIMATFDDRGRLFVCESAGKNLSAKELEKEQPNSIRLLQDTDRDGRFDKVTTFADKMTFPMGAAWYDGALYVASPPYIWKLVDTDGDGVADERTILVKEFGYTGNAASIHGCFRGPDGRLYWCDGYHGHEFRDASGKVVSKREGSYLFSCRPDGSDVQIHAGGGMDNPVEVDFLESGEMLGTVNILYTRPRVDCLVHWLYGGTYPHRQRILAERKVTGELLGPAHRFGHVAVSGMLRYRSGLMDHRWRDNLFVTFFNQGKVVRLELQRSGSTFAASQHEFLSSSSHDFHPTDVVEDADGSLLVIDTGGWFYRGCPMSQLAKPEIRGAIYRVRRRGMPKQNDPWGTAIEWDRLDDRASVQKLGDTREAVRRRAIDECARRGSRIVPMLRAAALRRDRPWRLGAIAALTQMATRAASGVPEWRGQSSDKECLKQVLPILAEAARDRDLAVRLAALEGLAVHPDPSSRSVLLECLADDAAAVRRVAAKALGRLRDAASVPALLAGLPRAVDRAEEHALVYALIEINDPSATAAGLSASSPMTRRGALIALDQMDHREADAMVTLEVVLDAVASSNESLRQAGMLMLRHRPKWLPETAPLLRRWFADPKTLQANRDAAMALLDVAIGTDAVARLVGDLLSDERLDAGRRSFLLVAIGRHRGLPAHRSWIAPIERELASSERTRKATAIAAVAAIRGASFDATLSAMVSSADLPRALRLSAIEAMAARNSRLSRPLFDVLIEMLDAATPSAERARAVQVLARASLTNDQLLELADLLSQAGPLALPQLIRPYQRTKDPKVARRFLQALEEARSLDSVAPNDLADVIKHYPKDVLPAANALLLRRRKAEQEKAVQVDRFTERLSSGDSERGRRLFFSERAKCSTCHRIGAEGAKIGPELTTIGANRAPRDLFASILFPSATLVRQYEPYMVALADGRVLNGLIVRETATELTLQPATGDPLVIDREDIEELAPSTVSVMPAGLEKELKPQELIDIVKFLTTCR